MKRTYRIVFTLFAAACGLTTGCKHAGNSCGTTPCQTAGILHVKPSPCGKPNCFVTSSASGNCGDKIITPTAPAAPVPMGTPNTVPPMAPKEMPKVMTKPMAPNLVSLPIPVATDIVVPPMKPTPSSNLPAITVPVQPRVEVQPLQPAEPVVTHDRGYLPRYEGNAKSNRAIDYKWIVGEVYYSANKKSWVLRYAGLDVDDDYGGSVTLIGADHLLDGVANGQLVRVEGDLQDRQRKVNAAPYRVQSLQRMQ